MAVIRSLNENRIQKQNTALDEDFLFQAAEENSGTSVSEFDIIVGSAQNVIDGLATHTIGNFVAAIQNMYKIQILDGTYNLIQSEDITESNVKIYFEPGAILVSNGSRTFTLSGNNNEVFSGRFSGFGTNGIILSGNDIYIYALDGLISTFQQTGIGTFLFADNTVSGDDIIANNITVDTIIVNDLTSTTIETDDLTVNNGALVGYLDNQGPLFETYHKITGATATYDVSTTERIIYFNGSVDCSIFLNDSSTDINRTLILKNLTAAKTMTILPVSGETIEGEASIILNIQYQGVELHSDGSNWWIIG